MPAASAATAHSTSRAGGSSSLDNAYPNSIVAPPWSRGARPAAEGGQTRQVERSPSSSGVRHLLGVLRHALPDRLDELQSRLLLLEVLVEQADALALAEPARHRDQPVVRRDLVMLRARRGARQEHVADARRGPFLLHERVVLRLDPLDPGALLALSRLA